jgi:hypothetical protein
MSREGAGSMDGMRAGQGDLAPLAQLGARLGLQGDSRLGQAVVAGAGVLHDLIASLRPSGEEFHLVLDFLTEVGHATDARRQEWVLLADVLGVSTRIEDLNAPRPPGATPNTLAGPFYRPDMPELPNGADLSRDGKGEP